jgi:hypothetical protein
MCIFVSCHTTLSAETTAHLFFTMVVAIHGLPRSIVSDRDTRFTSRFWSSLFARMGTRLRPTSSFHPQGNGQAEHINKMVEGYLRAYTMHRGEDWDLWLPHAQYVLNTSVCRTTGVTPFYMVYGRNPVTAFSLMGAAPPSEPPATTHFVNSISEIWEACTLHVKNTQAAAERYLNAGRTEVSFPVGSFVLLDRAYRSPLLKLPKMEPKHDGPFEIMARVGKQAYRLRLPETWRMHPVVWAGRLTPYHGVPTPGLVPRETVGPIDDIEYEIRRIVSHERTAAGLQYKVTWKGYPGFTWQAANDMTNCADMLAAYRKRVGLDRRPRARVVQPAEPS